MSIDQNLINQIKSWQLSGEKVVFVTGVFDILHIEHLRFLTKAKQLGNRLVVGIETDERVTQLKGIGRPVNSAPIRQEKLEYIAGVDKVFMLPKSFNTQKDWETCMEMLHPDIYAVSSHSGFLENKERICSQFGVQFVVAHQHNPGISTSNIINLLNTDH